MLDAVHLVVHEGRAAFVETGTSRSVPQLLAALASLGLSRDAVDWVFITHVHLDHAGGAGQLMQALPNAKAVLHPRGAPHMVDPRKLVDASIAVYGAEAFGALYGEILPIASERVVSTEPGQRFSLADRDFEILHTPGHAMHHQVFFDHHAKAVFTGDTFGLSYREFDVDGRAFAFPTTTPTQFDPDQLIDSIHRILALQPRTAYFTHYGEVRDLPRLAVALERMTRAFAEAAKEASVDADVERSLRDRLLHRISRVLYAEIEAHGCTLPAQRIDELLGLDIGLNVDGLIAWLARNPVTKQAIAEGNPS
ncbi:MAG: MBL fold metallo-hydrolase [Gammaproteobacteria bacterium]|nr:MBL fold metallo-hydrolase [Gammaproteobacteria bacterium]